MGEGVTRSRANGNTRRRTTLVAFNFVFKNPICDERHPRVVARTVMVLVNLEAWWRVGRRMGLECLMCGTWNVFLVAGLLRDADFLWWVQTVCDCHSNPANGCKQMVGVRKQQARHEDLAISYMVFPKTKLILASNKESRWRMRTSVSRARNSRGRFTHDRLKERRNVTSGRMREQSSHFGGHGFRKDDTFTPR